ncbi:hypothetical protein [Desulforamulus aeronauticus]|uniref:Uncharacterized protein n=1 Tax=Desulforamulus aeronauticus DSM 10349 TaxID=1121421 RepID=A0A1M6WSG5_9FIRM|nr:hypothetical protein [Desulforamulus aeronauticus]SHK96712.1 hypothetical protein SAMN02745123_03749 [Desulforamulus aeronauticus DSM 10349]
MIHGVFTISASATGVRGMRLIKNGVVTSEILTPPPGTHGFSHSFMVTGAYVAGDVISVSLFQDSGVTLNNTAVSIILVKVGE